MANPFSQNYQDDMNKIPLVNTVSCQAKAIFPKDQIWEKKSRGEAIWSY